MPMFITILCSTHILMDYLAGLMPTLPQSVVDASAGFGDTASFGITNVIRDALGINDVVDQFSGAYTDGDVGEVAGGVYSGGAGALRGAAAFGGTKLGHILNHN